LWLCRLWRRASTIDFMSSACSRSRGSFRQATAYDGGEEQQQAGENASLVVIIAIGLNNKSIADADGESSFLVRETQYSEQAVGYSGVGGKIYNALMLRDEEKLSPGVCIL